MAETLKSYLISIGYKVDQISQQQADAETKRLEERATDRAERAAEKRAKAEAKAATEHEKAQALAAKKEQERREATLKSFRNAAAQAAAAAVKTVAAVEAAALGVVYAVDKAAQSYDRLNYLSQRSSASAGGIKSFGYASSQLGSNREDAEATLEAFGKNVNLMGSGYAEALEKLSVKTRDANGHLREANDLAVDLGDVLRENQKHDGPFGYARSIAQAHTFGFGENQTRAMMNPQFRAFVAQQKADQKAVGADPDAAAKSGTAFEQSMRRLEEVLDAIGTKVSTVLFEKLKPLLNDLTKWFLAHGQDVADIIQRVASDLVDLATAIAHHLAEKDWNKILGNVQALASGFGVLLDKLGGEAGLVVVLGLLALRLSTIGNMLLPPWLRLVLAGGLAAVANTAETVDAIQTSKPAANDIYVDPETGYAQKVAPGTGNQVVGEAKESLVPRIRRHLPKWLGGIGGASSGWWTPDRQKHAYDYLKSRGFTDAGARAAVSRMAYVESTKDGPDAANASGHTGIFQASRSRAALYGNSSNFDDQLKAYADQAFGPDGSGAGKILSTTNDDAEAAAGASRMEKAEGYNSRSGRDAFTDKTLSNMDAVRRNVVPKIPSPAAKDGSIGPVSLGPNPVQSMMIASAARANLHVAHSPTFNVHGDDGGGRLETAAITAGRGPQDLLRNLQSAEA